MVMFPKEAWEIGDELVVEGVKRKIAEFNRYTKQFKLTHRDNENNEVVRWFEVKELPPYPQTSLSAAQSDSTPPPTPLPHGEGNKEEKPLPADAIVMAAEISTKQVQETAIVQAPESLRRGVVIHHREMNYNRVVESVDGLTLTLGMGCGKVQWDSSIWEIVPPDENVIATMLSNMAGLQGRINELAQQNQDKDKRLANQAASIKTMTAEDGSGDLSDKYEQLLDDYENQAKKLAAITDERDALKKSHEQQAEMLKQAASPTGFSTAVNANTINESLRAELKVLERENDKLKAELAKALKAPTDALEVRLARIEEKLEEATDWIEGDMALEKRVLEMSAVQPSNVTDISQVMLAFAKAFAMVGQERLVANG